MSLEPLSHVGLWVVALVFLASGAAKIRHPVPAAAAIASFGLLPKVLPIAGTMLGALEVGLALLLGSGLAPTVTLTASAALLGTFFALVVRALAAGRRFSCACFGSSNSPLSLMTALRAVGLGTVAASAAVIAPTDAGLAHVSSDDLAALVAASSVIALVVLGAKVRNLILWNASPYPVTRIDGE